MEMSIILQKICRWCAYQDRSEFETRQKLRTWNLKDTDIDKVIEYLKKEQYLNEERFMRAFIDGKLQGKKWGTEKIKYHLKHKHHIPEHLINQYIQNIDKEWYREKLKELLLKKKTQLSKKETDPQVLKKKIINFALSKGYTLSDILLTLQEIKL